MRKTASLLMMLMLFAALAFGQGRKVSGQIKNDKGDPVPFATIVDADNSRNATNADDNGFFSITIGATSKLKVSAVGYKPITVTPVGNSVTVAMVSDETNLREVVVTTAQNIKKRPKELGVAQTTLKGEQLTVGKSPQLGQALSGKVAGLTVYNTSNSVNPNPRIVLRGNRSITGNNQALIILDGVPVPSNTINYLNPNDIESVTVLKGGQAATLYGSDGVNGALVITTRKGGTKPTITFSHTSNFEQLAYLPEFQTEYGSGSGYGFSFAENFRPFENQQYGDHYDGSMRSPGRILQDGSYQEYPYSFIPGIRKKIWNTGYTMQNDASVSSGDANSSFYLSVQDVKTTGIVPKDEYRRDAVRFNASRTYGKFKASFDGSYTTDRSQRTTSDFYWFALNTPGWIPLDQLKDWKNNPFANPNGYFNDYYNNPWFELDNNRNDTRDNYFNGNLSLNFKPTKNLEFNYRVGAATTNTYSKSWQDKFDYSEYAKGNLPDKPFTHGPYNDYLYVYRARNSPIVGGVADGNSYGSRINSDFIASYSKTWDDFSLKILYGNNLQSRRSRSVTAASGSVVVASLFNVAYSANQPQGSEVVEEIRKVGNYGNVTLGFRDYLFLNGSIRHDQSSLFVDFQQPDKPYDYLYYGGDVSFVVTDAIPSLKSDFFSYMKLRASYNKNGNDNLAAYSLNPVYPLGTGFPYSGIVGTTVGNTYPDPNLSPEFAYTAEFGTELSLVKNRINIDATYYNQRVDNQILNVAISSATGYTNYLVNAAKVRNWGFESEVRANILRKKDWNIDLTANYTFNTNKVEELFVDNGLGRVQLNSNGSNAFIFAELDKPFPYLKTTAWVRDDQGRIVVDPNDGWPLKANDQRAQGNTAPKHQLGLGARISYKGFTLSANAEYRGGYVIYNDLGEDMAFTGSGQVTNLYHRQQFIWPNSSYFDGTKYVPNTTIPVDSYYAMYYGWGDLGFSRGLAGVGEMFATSGAFWKIRDASLAWNIPQRWVNKTKVVKSASLSVFGRNLFTWLPKDNIYTDPEFSTTNGNGIGINNSFNTPPVRQFGATLSVVF